MFQRGVIKTSIDYLFLIYLTIFQRAPLTRPTCAKLASHISNHSEDNSSNNNNSSNSNNSIQMGESIFTAETR